MPVYSAIAMLRNGKEFFLKAIEANSIDEAASSIAADFETSPTFSSSKPTQAATSTFISREYDDTCRVIPKANIDYIDILLQYPKEDSSKEGKAALEGEPT